MRKVEVQELRYYRYVILFNGQIKNEKAIIKEAVGKLKNIADEKESER